MKYLLSARHYAHSFTRMISFNTHSKPLRLFVFILPYLVFCNEGNSGLKDLGNLLPKMAEPGMKPEQFNSITFSLHQ